MHFLALNENSLKRLSVHFLWGLNADSSKEKNLYAHVLFLQSHPAQLEIIKNKVAHFESYCGFIGENIRAIFWLLNWDNYRVDYYILRGYYAWQLYKEEIMMFSPSEQEEINKIGAFLAKESSNSQAQKMMRSVVKPFKWVGNQVYKRLWGKQALIITPSPDSSPSFVIDLEMLPHLQTLGIIVEKNQMIANNILDSAYRKKALETHPDRNRGDRTQFDIVQNAYDTVKQMIAQRSDIFGWKAMLDQNMEEFHQQADELSADFKNISKDYKEIAQDYKEIAQDYHDANKRMDRLIEELRQMINDQEIPSIVTDIPSRVEDNSAHQPNDDTDDSITSNQSNNPSKRGDFLPSVSSIFSYFGTFFDSNSIFSKTPMPEEKDMTWRDSGM